MIGEAFAGTKKEAESEAYDKALQTLKTFKIDSEWAKKKKHELEFASPELQPYISRLQEKYTADGYSSVYFFNPGKTNTPKGGVIQLIGIRDTPEKQYHELLGSLYTPTGRDNGFKESRVDLVKKYLLSVRQ